MRAKGNIRNWFQFLNLRMRPDAQYEIRQYAEEVAKLIMWRWPKAYSLFEEYDLYAAHFSRTELKALRHAMDFDRCNEAALQLGLTGTKLKEFLDKLTFGGDKILS
jgi:thymidylate synthase (FAD)